LAKIIADNAAVSYLLVNEKIKLILVKNGRILLTLIVLVLD
jgi:hypothetical protein